MLAGVGWMLTDEKPDAALVRSDASSALAAANAVCSGCACIGWFVFVQYAYARRGHVQWLIAIRSNR